MLQVIEKDGVFMLADVVKTLARTTRKIVAHPSRGKGGGGHKIVHQNKVWKTEIVPRPGHTWKTRKGAENGLLKALEG